MRLGVIRVGGKRYPAELRMLNLAVKAAIAQRNDIAELDLLHHAILRYSEVVVSMFVSRELPISRQVPLGLTAGADDSAAAFV